MLGIFEPVQGISGLFGTHRKEATAGCASRSHSRIAAGAVAPPSSSLVSFPVNLFW
ncbi:MAG TPA: hypothetical protein VJY34_26945 [Roseiarcus sp.]|nr:hypothetical protein [Roseiarcus sp.]